MKPYRRLAEGCPYGWGLFRYIGSADCLYCRQGIAVLRTTRLELTIRILAS